MYKGWHQIAFERELESPLTGAFIGDLALVVVREGDSVRVFEAACPHRGANLSRGRLEADGIVCAFHGYRIGLGHACGGPLCAREYRALSAGGLVFVLLSEDHENGFSRIIRELDATHYIVPGFSLAARVRPELVIENAFDRRHFQAVHRLGSDMGLRLAPADPGILAVSGSIANTVNTWQKTLVGACSETTFLARIFCPNLCLTRLGTSGQTYYVLTAATPTRDGGSQIRVSVAGPAGRDGTPPAMEIFQALLRDSRTAFEQDVAVWESICEGAKPSYTPDDDLVQEYHRFCHEFLL